MPQKDEFNSWKRSGLTIHQNVEEAHI